MDIKEINVVRASDGSFIIRNLTEQGVSDIQTASDFEGLTSKLKGLVTVDAAQFSAPATQQ